MNETHYIRDTSQTLTVSARVVSSFRITTASFPLESKKPFKTNGTSGSSTLAIILSSDFSKNTSKHKSYLFSGQSNFLKVGSCPGLAKKFILFEIIERILIYVLGNDILNFYELKDKHFLTLCCGRIQCGTQNVEKNDCVFDFLNHGGYNERQHEQFYNKVGVKCLIF